MDPTGAVDLVAAISNHARTADDYTTAFAEFDLEDSRPDELRAAGALVQFHEGKFLICGQTEIVDRLVPPDLREPLRVHLPVDRREFVKADQVERYLVQQLAWFAELGHHRFAPVWSKTLGLSTRYEDPVYTIADGGNLLRWALHGYEVALSASCTFFVVGHTDSPAIDPTSLAIEPRPEPPDFEDLYQALGELHRQTQSISSLKPAEWLRPFLVEPRRVSELAVQGPYWGSTIEMLRLEIDPDRAHVVPIGRPTTEYFEGRWYTAAPLQFVRQWLQDHAPHADLGVRAIAEHAAHEYPGSTHVTGDPGLLFLLKQAMERAGHESRSEVTVTAEEAEDR